LFSRRNKINDRLNYWLLAIVLDLAVTGPLSYVDLIDIQGSWEGFLNITWLIVALFIVFCFYFLRELLYIVTSKNWPTTVGMINESRIHTDYNHRVNERPVKEFKISYSYSVNNTEYANELLKFFVYRRVIKFLLYWNTHEKPLYPLLEKYKTGQQVTVYYNPRNPLISVLEPGKYNRRPLIAHLIVFLLLSFFILPSIGLITSIVLLSKMLLSYIYFRIGQAWIRTTSLHLAQPSYDFSPEYSNRFDRNHIRSFPERFYCENCGTALQDAKQPCPLCSTRIE
jgi:hypothetical protein